MINVFHLSTSSVFKKEWCQESSISGKITYLSHYFLSGLGLWEIKEKQDAVTKTIKWKKPSLVFIINCVSLASLNTSRDIFQESLHINVSTYHCLYYLPIDKKVFSIFRARSSNKVQHECIYCGRFCLIKV